jgi:superfamily II DNA or RNA helicase
VTELFEAVREICPTEAWSRGVTLARSGNVVLETSNDEEVAARITVPGSPVSPRVHLFPAELEWECDCESPLDACEHVAAVVIARRQGVVSERAASPIVYRLSRSPEGLRFERGVEDERGFHPIEAPLDANAAGRVTGPRFDATPEDLAVEKALRGRFRRTLDASLLPALSRVEGITLDGKPVRVWSAPVLPEVRVVDDGDGFRLELSESRIVTERFRNGIVLAEDTLRPEGEPELTGREWEDLRRGRRYRADEVGELVGRVLPSLSTRIGLDVRTSRLPEAVRSTPRLSLFLERRGDALHVLPRHVYGDVVPLRVPEAERELERRLERELGLKLGRGEELSTETAIEFVRALDGLDVAIEGRAHEAFRLHGPLEPDLRVTSDDFDVSFRAEGGRRADPAVVLRAYREGRSLVPLLDGGFASLPEHWLDRYGPAIEDLLAARDSEGRLPKASIPELARLEGDEAREEEWPEAESPGSFRGELRHYQKRGVDWLVHLRRQGLGALLADDMGLGKTVQALAVLQGRSLVVAPTSVLKNWVSEASRFRPELSVCLYHGRDRALDPSADLTITSHALLRLDDSALTGVSWDTVVLDEAQAVRNPDTDLARAASALRARFRVSLTGTPVENRLVDLWSQFHFLNRGFLGRLPDFEERYVRPIERGDREPLLRLQERIRPYFLRRLKSEVAPELPPRTETTLRAELTGEERDLYEAMKLAARRDVLDKLETKGSVLAALEALLRLRQAACHPALVPGRSAETSSKTELLLGSLETAAAEGHKSLVFSQWTSMLDLLEPKLEASGHRFVRLDGATRDRGEVVERFQSDPEVSVFLVSLKAGGTGLNLTAADHVFLFDPWWNPAVEQQAFDRAHRIGQEKPVFVYRLVAADTVEERILDLQREKRELAQMSLTRDDIVRLLD